MKDSFSQFLSLIQAFLFFLIDLKLELLFVENDHLHELTVYQVFPIGYTIITGETINRFPVISLEISFCMNSGIAQSTTEDNSETHCCRFL